MGFSLDGGDVALLGFRSPHTALLKSEGRILVCLPMNYSFSVYMGVYICVCIYIYIHINTKNSSQQDVT